jgi:malate permease and related proteins
VIRVFLEVILPVLVMAGLGGVIGRRVDMPVQALSGLTFRLFSPALIFHSLVAIQLASGVAVRLIAVVLVVFVAVALASFGLSRVLGHDRATMAAVALCAAVANSGNMGLPMAKLAFGDEGLKIAVVMFVATGVLTYSAGVIIASLASPGRKRTAFAAPLKVPALWAAAIALVINAMGWTLPKAMNEVAGTLAGASIPAMLVVLGLQVMQRTEHTDGISALAGSVGLRLVGAPLAAWGATTLVGLDGVTQRTLILVAGMPTAVMASVLAMQYQAKPALVSRVVITSTLISIATLTVLVTILR